jgi:alkylation response protein AidB-like acyl-CoA dehydrogenase
MQAAAVAATFHDEIRRRADEIEASRRMPDDLARRMAEAGLFRLLVPRQYGGAQVHPREFFDSLMTTARADGAVGWCQMIGATTGLLAASLPDAWSRALYGDHPESITTGVTAPIGRAVAEAGGYRVSGRWPFGSGSQISDWICGGCLIMEDGEPRKDPRGAPESVLVFFPAEDVIIHDTWHTSGLCGTGSHDIEVRDVLVPEGRWAVLGGRPRVDEPLYRFPTLGLLALGVSAVALGIAEQAIEAFVALATEKVPTGTTRSLAHRSSAQRDLARARAKVDSARAMTYEIIDAAWAAAEQEGRLGLPVKARLRLAATNNAWSAAEAVDLLYHAAGGSAIYTQSPLQRCFRDVHVATQHLMVAQPTLEAVGKVLLNVDPKTLL